MHCWQERSRATYNNNREDPQVPDYISSQLRTWSFRNYGGLECELQFAKYIMQNSRVLQSMTVIVLGWFIVVGPYEMLDMLKKLSLCPRISPTCKLSFVPDRMKFLDASVSLDRT